MASIQMAHTEEAVEALYKALEFDNKVGSVSCLCAL